MNIKSKTIKLTIYLLVILGVISCFKKEDPTPSPSSYTPTPSSPTPSSPSPSSPTPNTSTRTVTFWNPTSGGYGNVKVTLSDGSSGTITVDYSSSPSCGSNGCANFYSKTKSTIGYYAEEINGTATWSGTIPSGSESCFTMQLY